MCPTYKYQCTPIDLPLWGWNYVEFLILVQNVVEILSVVEVNVVEIWILEIVLDYFSIKQQSH